MRALVVRVAISVFVFGEMPPLARKWDFSLQDAQVSGAREGSGDGTKEFGPACSSLSAISKSDVATLMLHVCKTKQ